MKKIIFLLLIYTSFTFGQDNTVVSGKINLVTSVIELPIEVKSDLFYKNNSSEFIKYERFCDELKGTITLITDSKNLVVALIMPSNTPSSKIGSIGKCLKSSFGSTGSGWSGFWNCVLN